jgi:uncharacterized protein YndB with AHSA1/START domain
MTNTKNELIIVREFNAPKAVVFEAFSNSEALAEWWGPKGFPVTVVKLDFRPGVKKAKTVNRRNRFVRHLGLSQLLSISQALLLR